MPIHGEYKMLKNHAKIAEMCGVNPRRIFVINNGQILHILEDRAFIKGVVENGETYIDGSLIGSFSNEVVNERKLLSMVPLPTRVRSTAPTMRAVSSA